MYMPKKTQGIENAQKTEKNGDNFHQDMDGSQLSYQGNPTLSGLALSLEPQQQPMTSQIFIGLILRPETCGNSAKTI